MASPGLNHISPKAAALLGLGSPNLLDIAIIAAQDGLKESEVAKKLKLPTKSVVLNDFLPINNGWDEEKDGQIWSDGTARYIIDKNTNRRYFNEGKWLVRFKCLQLTLGTPFVHSVASIVNVACRILKLITLSHFWLDKEREEKYDFTARLADAGADLLRIVATPFAFLGLELAAFYGLFMPYDGRKIYATIERAIYGDFLLAPCFQPDPKSHLFGGDPNKKNSM